MPKRAGMIAVIDDSAFATKPNLVGKHVVLRPFRAEDAGAMVRILADPEVQRLTGMVPSKTDASGEKPLLDSAHQWYSSRAEQDDRLDLAVGDRGTGEVVGEVVLNEWDPNNGSCNFRTLFGPHGRDRGLGTEAAQLVLAYAFDVVGLHRVGLEVYSFNPRARRVYEKLGFVCEGTRREVLRFDDRWVDSDIMSVLATEWAQHRDNPTMG